ncbi:MAG: DNA recombination protein RmuC [Bacteroidetes bacterium]|nr:MAG: DNA recombination protein RmuC [Bacteroidota bacterium]
MEIIYVLSGIVLGVVFSWLLFQGKIKTLSSGYSVELANAEKRSISTLNEMDKEKVIIEEKLSSSQKSNETLQKNLFIEKEKNSSLEIRIAESKIEMANLQEKLDNEKTEIEGLQKKFTTEFHNIANNILRQNSQEFTDLNKKNIHDILSPLKEKIHLFEKKVEDTYTKGLKDQTDLQAELKKLHDLNSKISDEANNLTRALKSDNKMQGNWGELILEKVLERSGLTKGQEYETQATARNEHGGLLRPDVVIKLPDNKHIIIDSKVSLVAYEAYINSDNGEAFLKQHIESIRKHVKGLADKNYQHAASFDSPDFVLLFMPIESAFSAAVQADVGLFNFAWDKKIVIVSPTTLLATLRTIASIWKHEKQTQNALEIAKQGGALYDKFHGLVEDIDKLGKQLNTVQKTFDNAKNKLTDGRGNLIGQVEKLKTMGANTAKSLPNEYLDDTNQQK